MFGGLATQKNLLCVAHAEARGKVFLFDLEERRLASFWEYGGEDEAGGYADAGGVAMAADFSLYVADARNDVVRHFNPFGMELGRVGRTPEGAPGAQRRDRNGTLDRPRAVAVFEDTLFVGCGEGKLRRGVQRFRRNGVIREPLRSFGEAEGRFGAPRGLFVDHDGLLVADTLHGVVQRFTVDGRYVGHFSTAHAPGESSRPAAVVRMACGDVLVAESGDRPGLRRFGIDGAQRDPVATDVELLDPIALARGEEGRLYVLDRDGERVQRLDAEGTGGERIVDLAEVLYGA